MKTASYFSTPDAGSGSRPRHRFFTAILAFAGSGLAAYCFAAPPQLQVSGNRIISASGGCTVRLRGVDLSGLEYSDSGDSGTGYPATVINGVTMTDYSALIGEAVTVWHCNFFRLPLNQDYWFGCTNAAIGNKAVTQAAYQGMVQAAVSTCNALDAYIDLDLHWSGTSGGSSPTTPCGGSGWGTAVGQQTMPDWNAVAFWSSAAATFANNPSVLFDLYNEPHDVGWGVWLSGGSAPWTVVNGAVTTTGTLNTPGLQRMLNAVRGAGANNICLAGGLNWAFDLTGLPAYDLSDTSSGMGVAYSSHVYSIKGYPAGGSQWDTYVTNATATNPPHAVIIEEFGAFPADGASWDPAAISWINGANNQGYVYSAMSWAFSPDVSPSLLTSFSGFTATSYHGAPVSTWLSQLAQTPGTICSTSTPTGTPVATSTPTATGTPVNTGTATSTPASSTSTATGTPANTGTSTSTPSSSPTRTPTATFTAAPILCGQLFNGCETLSENGNWTGTDANRSIVTSAVAPPGAITQGSGALLVDVQIPAGWEDQIFNLDSFTPPDFSGVTQLVLDINMDPCLNGGSYSQLFLYADAYPVTTYQPISYDHPNLSIGQNNNVTFNINFAAGGIPPGTPLTKLNFIYNNDSPCGFGPFYVDNIRIVRNCTPTPVATGTSTRTPTPLMTSTASWTVTSTSTRTMTLTPIATPSSTPSPTATATYTPTSSVTPTWTPTPSATPSSTLGLAATASSTSTSTDTTSPTASMTPSASLTTSFTPSATPTVTRTPPGSPTPGSTLTATDSPSVTPTPTGSPTTTSTGTWTSTPPAPASATLSTTNSPTSSPTPTRTATPSFTPSQTPTHSSTATSTASFTTSFTSTPSWTPTASLTPTVTASPTPTSSPTLTDTPCGWPGNTCTPSLPTATGTPISGDDRPFPNPWDGRGPLVFFHTVAPNSTGVSVKLFTTLFRKIYEDDHLPASPGRHLCALDWSGMRNPANGLYYLVVTDWSGGRPARQVMKLLIER